MKILQLTDSLGNGGAEKFIVELCNELAEKHNVLLCSVKPVEDWIKPPKKMSKKVELIVFDLNKIFSVKYLYSIFTLLKNTKPDVVHIHSSILVFKLFLACPFLRDTKFIQTVHSTLTPGYKKLLDFMSRFRFVNKRFVNVCISDFIFQEFLRKYPNLYFKTIDNGIVPMRAGQESNQVIEEINGYKCSKQTRVFTAIGNYSRFKNFVVLAEIFNEMSRDGQDIILLLIGTGRHGESLENYQRVVQIKGKNIYQLGFKTNIADYLEVSDALIISSLKEGMPLVALEALSLGVPIVTTPAGGMVNVVKDGKNGYMAENLSEHAIKDVITRFLNTSEDDLDKIRMNNKKRFNQKYSMQKCANHYAGLYQKICSKK